MTIPSNAKQHLSLPGPKAADPEEERVQHALYAIPTVSRYRGETMGVMREIERRRRRDEESVRGSGRRIEIIASTTVMKKE
jgi:hypothetical protein